MTALLAPSAPPPPVGETLTIDGVAYLVCGITTKLHKYSHTITC